MSTKRPRSPWEKKALSYARYRRNDYGENDKASRKAIPARKAGGNRKVRRKAHEHLKTLGQASEAAADVRESSLRHDLDRAGGWTKSPHVALGKYLARLRWRRAWRDRRRRTPD